MRCSVKNVAAVVATAVMSAPQVACGAHPRGDGTGTAAARMRTLYLLAIYPGTTTSNEQHTPQFQATASVCGHRAPVRGARVRLDSYRVTQPTRMVAQASPFGCRRGATSSASSCAGASSRARTFEQSRSCRAE
jgi:hypothetical protein